MRVRRRSRSCPLYVWLSFSESSDEVEMGSTRGKRMGNSEIDLV
jgi:hypothetical protein